MLRGFLGLVLVAGVLGAWAFWLETTAMNRFAPAPALSADAPVPTCQAVYQPTGAGTCARRDVTPCPYTGPAASDTCDSAAEQTLETQYAAYMQTCSPTAPSADQQVCSDMARQYAGSLGKQPDPIFCGQPGRVDPC